MKKGDVYYADLNPIKGSEQGGTRPVVILQNNVGNKHSPTTIVAPITSKILNLPTHVYLSANDDIKYSSNILLEQIRAIDKSRLKLFVCKLSEKKVKEINKALIISLDLGGV